MKAKIAALLDEMVQVQPAQQEKLKQQILDIVGELHNPEQASDPPSPAPKGKKK